MLFLPSHRFSHGGKFVALASNVAPTSRLQTVEDVTLLTTVVVIKGDCVVLIKIIVALIESNITKNQLLEISRSLSVNRLTP